MEFAGLALGGIALLPPLAHCANKIRKAVKKIKSSRRDIYELADQTIIFSGLCEEFLRECVDNHQAHAGRVSSVRVLNTWNEKILEELREVLQKVEAVVRTSSLQQTLIAYLEWFFSKASVKHIQERLAVAQESIKGYTNLMCIQKLNKELRLLKNALAQPLRRERIEIDLGMKIEEKIQMVKDAMHIKTSVQDTNKRQLKAAIRQLEEVPLRAGSGDFSSAPSELLQFAESLNTFTEEVLPSRQLHSRSQSFTTSRHASTRTRPLTPRRPFVPEKPDRPDTTTSSSVSILESGSIRASVTTSSSISSNLAVPVTSSPSQRSREIPVPDTAQMHKHTAANNGVPFHDPEGRIPSPLQGERQHTSVPLRRSMIIGRHVVGLNATEITVNDHSLSMDDYDMGLQFFESLSQNKDKLDMLDEALGQELNDWEGIPGWVVMPTEVSFPPAIGGIRDV